MTDFPTQAERDALARCFERARGSSGGEARVRRFLFAWWNAPELGGFDFSDLWGLSHVWRADVLTVIGMIARGPDGWYADKYGHGKDMEALWKQFGPKGDSTTDD